MVISLDCSSILPSSWLTERYLSRSRYDSFSSWDILFGDGLVSRGAEEELDKALNGEHNDVESLPYLSALIKDIYRGYTRVDTHTQTRIATHGLSSDTPGNAVLRFVILHFLSPREFKTPNGVTSVTAPITAVDSLFPPPPLLPMLVPRHPTLFSCPSPH